MWWIKTWYELQCRNLKCVEPQLTVNWNSDDSAICVVMQSDMWDHLKRSPYSTTGKLLTGIWQKFQTQSLDISDTGLFYEPSHLDSPCLFRTVNCISCQWPGTYVFHLIGCITWFVSFVYQHSPLVVVFKTCKYLLVLVYPNIIFLTVYKRFIFCEFTFIHSGYISSPSQSDHLCSLGNTLIEGKD